MPTLINKHSETPDAVPAVTELLVGEIAVNTADKKWFTKTTAGEVVCLNLLTVLDGGEISGAAPPSVFISTPGTNNFANRGRCCNWDGAAALDPAGNVTTVGTNGATSAYGARDMRGNVAEWTSDLPLWQTPNSASRGILGDSYQSIDCPRDRQSSDGSVSYYSDSVGFRIASPANVYSLPNFFAVGDINNTADTIMSPAVGAVSYTYYMGIYEVTNTEYAAFLNSVAAADPNSLYVMEELYDANDDPYTSYPMSLVRSGITRSGTSGNYTYAVKTNYGNKPVNNITWLSAARYCKWLHNNKPTGAASSSTTEDGAYTMSATPITKNSGAKYRLPTVDEWWKAAYYKGGGTNAGYWDYPTQSNTAPPCCDASSLGDGLKP